MWGEEHFCIKAWTPGCGWLARGEWNYRPEEFMNGDWLLLTQAALATMATNFNLAVVKSLCAAINVLTRPLL